MKEKLLKLAREQLPSLLKELEAAQREVEEREDNLIEAKAEMATVQAQVDETRACIALLEGGAA